MDHTPNRTSTKRDTDSGLGSCKTLKNLAWSTPGGLMSDRAHRNVPADTCAEGVVPDEVGMLLYRRVGGACSDRLEVLLGSQPATGDVARTVWSCVRRRVHLLVDCLLLADFFRAP